MALHRVGHEEIIDKRELQRVKFKPSIFSHHTTHGQSQHEVAMNAGYGNGTDFVGHIPLDHCKPGCRHWTVDLIGTPNEAYWGLERDSTLNCLSSLNVLSGAAARNNLFFVNWRVSKLTPKYERDIFREGHSKRFCKRGLLFSHAVAVCWHDLASMRYDEKQSVHDDDVILWSQY